MKLRNLVNKILFGRTLMADATAKNYTDEMVSTMVDQYSAEPTKATVEALASTFGKSTRSIIAKLSREGVYVAQPRTTKAGTPIVRKGDIVAEIAQLLGAHESDTMSTLVKASKADLLTLKMYLGFIAENTVTNN